MTTDKPGEVAIEAAREIKDRERSEGLVSYHEVPRLAAIIQAAINEATAAVEADLEACKAVRRLQNKQLRELGEARAAVRELGEALDRLAGEVGGCWRMDEPMLRREIGNTNYSVVAQRQEEAVAAMTKYAALLAEPEGGG